MAYRTDMDNDTLYNALLDNLNEGVCIVDRDQRIIAWNRGAERITGYSAAEVLGKSCTESFLVHMDSNGSFLFDTACALDGAMCRTQQLAGKMFILHKDGHRVPVQTHVELVRNSAGEVTD